MLRSFFTFLLSTNRRFWKHKTIFIIIKKSLLCLILWLRCHHSRLILLNLIRICVILLILPRRKVIKSNSRLRIILKSLGIHLDGWIIIISSNFLCWCLYNFPSIIRRCSLILIWHQLMSGSNFVKFWNNLCGDVFLWGYCITITFRFLRWLRNSMLFLEEFYSTHCTSYLNAILRASILIYQSLLEPHLRGITSWSIARRRSSILNWIINRIFIKFKCSILKNSSMASTLFIWSNRINIKRITLKLDLASI